MRTYLNANANSGSQASTSEINQSATPVPQGTLPGGSSQPSSPASPVTRSFLDVQDDWVNADQIRRHMESARAALALLGKTRPELNTDQALDILLGICFAESRCQDREQTGGGPGLGILQVEPNTFSDIWELSLADDMDSKIRENLEKLVSKDPVPKDWEGNKYHYHLIHNDVFAFAIARLRLRWDERPLPEAGNTARQGEIWASKAYNGDGAGTKEHYIKEVLYAMRRK